MSGVEEYSDDESVIVEREVTESRSRSGVLSTLSSIVSPIIRSAISQLVGPSTSEPPNPMSGPNDTPRPRPGQMEYRIYKTKQSDQHEDKNRRNFRALTGLDRAIPTMVAGSSSSSSLGHLRPIAKPNLSTLDSPLLRKSSTLDSPRLSDPTKDGLRRKCSVPMCSGTFGSNNRCDTCERTCIESSPPPILSRPYGLEKHKSNQEIMPHLLPPGMPKLTPCEVVDVDRTPERKGNKRPKVDTEREEKIDTKREEKFDTKSEEKFDTKGEEVEEVKSLPPVLPLERQAEKMIPVTPPGKLEDGKCDFMARELYLGNIKCKFRSVQRDSEAIFLQGVSPEASGKQSKCTKFNITIPFKEVRRISCYGERGNKAGSFLYFLVDRGSSAGIMNTMKKFVPLDNLFDSTIDHDGVKYLYVICEPQFNLIAFKNFLLTSKPFPGDFSSIGYEIHSRRHLAITSNAYKRFLQTNVSTKPGQQSFCHSPSTSRYRGSMQMSPPKTSILPSARQTRFNSKPTQVEIIELDDDSNSSIGTVDGTRRSTRNQSVRQDVNQSIRQDLKTDPDVDPDEMLFVYPPNESDQVTIYGRDLKCLEPEEYLNDNIIDFYLQ